MCLSEGHWASASLSHRYSQRAQRSSTVAHVCVTGRTHRHVRRRCPPAVRSSIHEQCQETSPTEPCHLSGRHASRAEQITTLIPYIGHTGQPPPCRHRDGSISQTDAAAQLYSAWVNAPIYNLCIFLSDSRASVCRPSDSIRLHAKDIRTDRLGRAGGGRGTISDPIHLQPTGLDTQC